VLLGRYLVQSVRNARFRFWLGKTELSEQGLVFRTGFGYENQVPNSIYVGRNWYRITILKKED
jgi:hypothetical protein